MGNIRTTLNLPEEVLNKLREIATRRGISMTEAFRGALKLNAILEDELQKGKELMLYDPKNDKYTTVLIIQSF